MSDLWAPDSTPPTPGPDLGRVAGPWPPPRVPDHELIRRIGRGAYGEVWLARSATGAFRAVKIVHRQSFDHDRPFEREFEGILKFEPISRQHDSQVDILHVGRSGDSFYYVMELADDQVTGGQIHPDNYTPRTLKSEVLFHGRLRFEECVRIGLALTTALENLHANGLAHRDVKPSNIIYVNGVPKLADIGLVAGVEATRSYVGTEGFAAPEGPGSPQADLYSLGKVLYELSTGKDRQEFPELPTQLRELPDREGLMELNAVIARACRHDPKDRYTSASAMHADLELLQSGKSLARLHRVEQRLRVVGRLATVTTVFLAIISVGWLWQARQAGIVRRLAADKTQLAEERSKLADENRQRLVRLDIANGVRLMDADDYSGALLWFAEALPLLTNNPAEEAIHRIRIQQVLSQSPRLLQVLPHEANVPSGAFSPDGRRVATGTATGNLRVWDTESGALVIGPRQIGRSIEDLHFTENGTRLQVRSRSDQGTALTRREPGISHIWREMDSYAVVLDAATGQPVFPGVTNVVRTRFSPDDRWLVAARTNFVIAVFDATDGRPVTELSGHTAEITMFSFSSDGSLLASASRDKTVRLWRLPSGVPVGLPIRHDEAVTRVVVSSDSRRLATATDSPAGSKWGSIHTWDLSSGTEIGTAIPANETVHALDFDPFNRRRLITGDDDRWMNVWDTDSHTAAFSPLRFENSTARCWTFSPDGLRFAAGSDDGTARVWDLETGESQTPRLRHAGWVESIHFSPDGRRLLTTSDDATAKIWDLGALPEAAKPLKLNSGVISGLPVSYFPYALSGDGRRLLISSERGERGELQLVRLDTLRVEGVPMPTPDSKPVEALRFDSSGRQWAAANGLLGGEGLSSTVGLWREVGQEVRYQELRHPKPVRKVQFNKEGSHLITWCDDGWLRTWRTSDGKILNETEFPDIVWLSAVSAEGVNALAIRRKDNVLSLFQLRESGGSTVGLAGAQFMNHMAFSPEGDRLATAGWDQLGHIWNVATGQESPPPFKHGGNLHWVEWSLDGRRLLTVGLAPNVKVWDAATGEPAAAPFELGMRPLRVAHFSPDGRFVVARSDDRTVRVWDSKTAEPVTPVLKHQGVVNAVMITRDHRLVTVSEPAVIRAWELTPARLPAEFIAEYARWQCGFTLDRSGVMRALKVTEMTQLSQTLTAKQPALFTTEEQSAREWHRRQISELSSLARVRAASFHLDRLAELDPLDPEVKALRAQVQLRQIPARDPATPPNLIDLSDHFTHSFGVLPNQEFTNLPVGLHTLAGTRFDLRGLVRLKAADSDNDGDPALFRVSEARNILVGQRCRVLQFLQAVDDARAKDGAEVARWVIHYADGSVQEWPIVYGDQTRDWWWWSESAPKEAKKAVIAWEAPSPSTLPLGANRVLLFKATWTNPFPEVVISHVDFILGKLRVQPFVVAITAE